MTGARLRPKFAPHARAVGALNGITLLTIPEYWHIVLRGSLIIGAALFKHGLKRRSA